MIRIETDTQAGNLRFLECTALGLRVENEKRESGIINFERVQSVVRVAPEQPKAGPVPAVLEATAEIKPAPAETPPSDAVKKQDRVEGATESVPVNGAMILSDHRFFWGMGSAEGISDPYSARRRSARAARSALADLLIADQDLFDGMPYRDREARITSLRKAIVKNSRIVDRWTDAANDRLFSVAVLPAGQCGLERYEAILLWSRLYRGQNEAR